MLKTPEPNPKFIALTVFTALFCLLTLGFAEGLYAETLYVKKSGTKLREAGSARSKVLTKLNKGTPVKVLKKSRKFYQVTAAGKKGWVFKFKLTAKQPARAESGGGFLDALGGRQQMAARESSSGSSIRGLSPVAEKYAKTKGIAEENIQAVKHMEDFRVDPEELDQFLAEGKLGEYGQ